MKNSEKAVLGKKTQINVQGDSPSLKKDPEYNQAIALLINICEDLKTQQHDLRTRLAPVLNSAFDSCANVIDESPNRFGSPLAKQLQTLVQELEQLRAGYSHLIDLLEI